MIPIKTGYLSSRFVVRGNYDSSIRGGGAMKGEGGIKHRDAKIGLVVIALVVVGLGAAVLAAPAQAAIIVNGSFEEGVAGTYRQGQVVGGGSLPGWVVDVVSGSNPQDFSVDLTAVYWASFDGLMSLDLEGSFQSGGSLTPGSLSGSVSQVLNTTAGVSHTLQFYMGGNYGGPSSLAEAKFLEVLWNGMSLGTFTYRLHPGDTISDFTWDRYKLVIPATAVLGSDRLTFRSINPQTTGHGAVIDAVKIVPKGNYPAPLSENKTTGRAK